MSPYESNRSPSLTEVPIEIRTTLRGVEYVVPRTFTAGRGCTGAFFILFGLFFIVPPSVILWAILQGDNAPGGVWWMYLFLVPFFAVGLAAVAFGLVIVLGHVWAWIEDDVLVVRKGLGFLGWTQRHPLSSIQCVALAPGAVRGRGLADVRVTLANGKQTPIVQNLTADALRPLAEDLAARCRLALDDRTRSLAGTIGSAGHCVSAPTTVNFPRRANVMLSAPASMRGWVGLLVFAVFWNGVSWTAAAAVLAKFEDLGWCPLLFVSVFCGIGLLLIVALVNKMLAAAKMHPPVVRVSVQPLYLGESFACRIQQQAKGRVTIEAMEVKLVCRESATYRQGTDTTTVTHDAVVISKRVAEGAMLHPAQPLVADLEFQIPADGMHSFEAARNKIEWLLDLRTKIPRWPDYTAQFLLHVAPKRHIDQKAAEDDRA